MDGLSTKMLQKLFRLTISEEIDEAIFEVFDYFDNLYSKEKWEEGSQFILDAYYAHMGLHTDILVAILSATVTNKNAFFTRKLMVKRVTEILTKEDGPVLCENTMKYLR